MCLHSEKYSQVLLKKPKKVSYPLNLREKTPINYSFKCDKVGKLDEPKKEGDVETSSQRRIAIKQELTLSLFR